MIKNVIFDLGGVVFDEKNGATMKPLREVTCDAVFKMLWSNLLLGRITMEECQKMLISESRFGGSFEGRANAEKLSEINTYDFYLENLPPYLETIDFIKQIEEECNVYVLSNATDAMKNYALEYFSRTQCPVKDTMFSCDEHLMKPDFKIFRLAICKFRVEPAETLYLDDKLRNCVAAKMCGMKAAVIEKPDDVARAFIENI